MSIDAWLTGKSPANHMYNCWTNLLIKKLKAALAYCILEPRAWCYFCSLSWEGITEQVDVRNQGWFKGVKCTLLDKVGTTITVKILWSAFPPALLMLAMTWWFFFLKQFIFYLFSDPLWCSQILLQFQQSPSFKGITSTDLCLVSNVGNHFEVSRPFRFSNVRNGSLVVTGNLDAFLVRSLEGGATDQNRNM